jgi:hypothetical protein
MMRIPLFAPLLIATWIAPLNIFAQETSEAPQKKAAKKPTVAAKEKPKATKPDALVFPPALPDGKASAADTSEEFLKPAATLKEDVTVARTAPKIDFLYYPGQDYAGNPWSNWGDSLAVNGKYYASIGDHLAPAGNAFVYEYDPERKTFRKLADIKQLLNMPEGHYVPGKIHSRLDIGSDGWIYFGTHRGSPKVTTDQYHYEGDWILRCNPSTGASEVVARGPVPKHAIPTSVLDPKRLIFYGGTAEGADAELKGIRFFAYDVKAGKVIQTGPDGPYRYLIFSKSTGKAYYASGSKDDDALMRFDPSAGGPPVQLNVALGLRVASEETPQGFVYTMSSGQGKGDATLWAFDTKKETVETIGQAAVGSQAYVASLDADPTGRYLYYVPGAHGGSEQDDSAVVQYDTKTRTRKVIAFLNPFYSKNYGCTLKGTYSTAVDPKGDKLYITWNASRNSKVWDCCALTVIHIPESERMP